eukprot:366569-Chlamydomonas_euryale.AAC.46
MREASQSPCLALGLCGRQARVEVKGHVHICMDKTASAAPSTNCHPQQAQQPQQAQRSAPPAAQHPRPPPPPPPAEQPQKPPQTAAATAAPSDAAAAIATLVLHWLPTPTTAHNHPQRQHPFHAFLRQPHVRLHNKPCPHHCLKPQQTLATPLPDATTNPCHTTA